MSDFGLNQSPPADSTCVTSMSSVDARKYFLKSSSYSDLELPHYFDFAPLLHHVSLILGNVTLDEYVVAGKNVAELSDVNYTLHHNRDGAFAVRPYQFINPALYVSLAHEITRPDAWKRIINRFRAFAADPRLSVAGIPTEHNGNQADRCAMVRSWYHGMEQQSISYSLSYRHLFTTDISDCHGSIRPSSVVRALHGLEMRRTKLSNPFLLGNVIANHLRMIAGPTGCGLPSGTMLMNFVSELVLGYVDQQLMESVKRAEGSSSWDFKVIRFRDDYRIFVNSPLLGNRLLTLLSEALASMGMKLSADKTRIFDDVITGSIKADKLDWLYRPPCRDLKNSLIAIRKFGLLHPNSGSLIKALSHCLGFLDASRHVGSSLPLIAIVADIMSKSPRTYPLGCALISRLLGNDCSATQVLHTLSAVLRKCGQFPNTGLLKIWLQRVAYARSVELPTDEPLCHIVHGDECALWNSKWLSIPLNYAILRPRIVDMARLSAQTPEIHRREVCMFY
jgi:hypothetical protein